MVSSGAPDDCGEFRFVLLLTAGERRQRHSIRRAALNQIAFGFHIGPLLWLIFLILKHRFRATCCALAGFVARLTGRRYGRFSVTVWTVYVVPASALLQTSVPSGLIAIMAVGAGPEIRKKRASWAVA